MSRRVTPAIPPHQKSAKIPRTAADALSAISCKFTAMALVSRKEKAFFRALRRMFRAVSEMFNQPLEAIYLDELVEIEDSLLAYLGRLDIKRGVGVQYCCDLRKLLDLLHDEFRWTSKAYELRAAWYPIRAALRDHGNACGSIVSFAIRQKKTPSKFVQQTMDEWKEYMLARNRSLRTVEDGERRFRKMLRDAGLQHAFPPGTLDSRNPPEYRFRLRDRESGQLLPDLPDSLRDEILEVIRWKTADRNLKDRPAKLLIRPITGEALMKSFVEIYSIAVKELGIQGIQNLSQLVTEENILAFIEWLQRVDANGKPRAKNQSIISKLSSLEYLTRTYPKFQDENFEWFKTTLKSLRREKHCQVQARKLETLPKYPEIAEIVPKLLAIREEKTLTPREEGFLIRDALIYMIHLATPHRSRNTCEASFHADMELNIYETEISSELRTEFKFFPDWAEKIRSEDPEARFLVCHWFEEETKGNHEVWELFPREAIPLLGEYVDHYRQLLLGISNADSTLLFFNRNCEKLTRKSLLDLVSRVSVRFAKKRMTVKHFRDLVAAQMLEGGASVDQVAALLWHLNTSSTTVRYYIGGYNTSHAAAELEVALPALAA